ncbi:MAG: hypothetical protein O2895_04680 [Chloroflexi bacterium]|nr:hypothetical protein [Chloroflexota bacterium]
MLRATSTLPWLLPIVFAASAWFFAGFRLMERYGADEAASAAGLIVALAVTTTLWRWAQEDRLSRALRAARCPRCSAALRGEHEHALAGSPDSGLQLWECAGCGYRHSAALTCRLCSP